MLPGLRKAERASLEKAGAGCSACKSVIYHLEMLLFSPLSYVMVALLAFFFLGLENLDLNSIFPFMSQLCALQSQENFGCKWYNLAKLYPSPKTIMNT